MLTPIVTFQGKFGDDTAKIIDFSIQADKLKGHCNHKDAMHVICQVSIFQYGRKHGAALVHSNAICYVKSLAACEAMYKIKP